MTRTANPKQQYAPRTQIGGVMIIGAIVPRNYEFRKDLYKTRYRVRHGCCGAIGIFTHARLEDRVRLGLRHCVGCARKLRQMSERLEQWEPKDPGPQMAKPPMTPTGYAIWGDRLGE